MILSHKNYPCRHYHKITRTNSFVVHYKAGCGVVFVCVQTPSRFTGKQGAGFYLCAFFVFKAGWRNCVCLSRPKRLAARSRKCVCIIWQRMYLKYRGLNQGMEAVCQYAVLSV